MSETQEFIQVIGVPPNSGENVEIYLLPKELVTQELEEYLLIECKGCQWRDVLRYPHTRCGSNVKDCDCTTEWHKREVALTKLFESIKIPYTGGTIMGRIIKSYSYRY